MRIQSTLPFDSAQGAVTDDLAPIITNAHKKPQTSTLNGVSRRSSLSGVEGHGKLGTIK